MEQPITVRVIIELLGKPQEHIEKTIREYVDQIKKDKAFQVQRVEFSEIKKQDQAELWAAFAELEFTTDLSDFTSFCFQYMPSVIEVLEPRKITFTDEQASLFLNDLQARLHQVDMIAKQLNMEVQYLKKNMTGLFRNYLTVLLSNRQLTAPHISTLTGVPQDAVEDYLDVLIDEKVVKMDRDKYILVQKSS